MTEAEPPQSADENKLIAERRRKLRRLRGSGPVFPNDFRRTALCGELQAAHAHRERSELEREGQEFSVCGRLIRNRGAFLLIEDVSGQMQLYINRQQLSAPALAEIGSWDLGDIIGGSGLLHKSGRGDLYINLAQARLLTKSLRPLPDKYHGLEDRELRYRRRHVDLIANPESRRVFRLRSRMVDFIRHFFQSRHFMEVETPMLHSLPGGATARPFVTHHHALGSDMYLRIAPELYLKRLLVGGFERVFEINRSFRNEGLSTRHNPEFTMLEYYWAYADYRDAMELTEELLRTMAQELLGSTTISYQGQSYDLTPPFRRMSLFDAILHYNPELAAAELAAAAGARAIAGALEIPLQKHWGLGKLQIEIFEKTVEHRLDQPTFITSFPTEGSPLARARDDDPELAERFELFVAGRELANGFSELNDAEEQAVRFRSQLQDKEAGNDEAMHYDADYLMALEYGMPPAAGEGIGIDRLVMLLADVPSIRDVLLFPHLRPE